MGHKRGDRVPSAFGEKDFDTPTYLDRQPFREYCDEISKLIHAADHALSIGEIHRMLGPRKRDRWTADALESLSVSSIEPVGVKPTRYRSHNRRGFSLVEKQKDQNARLFAK